MCKHFLENNICPLKQYCQFAHGPSELRQPNDPLPKNFGKTALGAVHSNYKTQKCKLGAECKFGEGCSFYHDESDRRELTDPLPNLPEGVTLPPMPEKMKSHHNNKRNNYGYNKYENGNNFSPSNFSPNYNQNQMIQITSIADLAALSGGFGGFNPNKYMTPVPNVLTGFNNQYNMNGFGNMPPHMMYQQQMQMQMYQQPMANGQPMPFGTQTPGNSTPSSGGQQSKYPKTGSPNKNGQRYEKKDKNNSA